MNPVLIRAFWRERFTSPIRMTLLVMNWALVLALSVLRKEVPIPDPAWTVMTVLILGAGVIGRDLSTGVLQLVLARPVGRTSYVLSRWIALGTAACAIGLAAWLLVLPFALKTGTSWAAAFRTLAGIVTMAYGVAAAMTGFSALAPGFGDLALMFMGASLATAFGIYGSMVKNHWGEQVAQQMYDTIFPGVDPSRMWVNGHLRFYEPVTWISCVTLYLLVAIVVLNRRELSYASAS